MTLTVRNPSKGEVVVAGDDSSSAPETAAVSHTGGDADSFSSSMENGDRTTFKDEGGKDEERKDGSSRTEEQSVETYPADCYSFLALHGPLENPQLFSFGFLVWASQILVLARLSPPSNAMRNDMATLLCGTNRPHFIWPLTSGVLEIASAMARPMKCVKVIF